MSLLALQAVSRLGVRARGGARATRVAGQIEQLAIRTPSQETPVSSLSGGNQQKVLFARSLLAQPGRAARRRADARRRRRRPHRALPGAARRSRGAGRRLSSSPPTSSSCRGSATACSSSRAARSSATLEGDEITEENITGAAITSATSRRAELAARARRALRVRRFVAGDYLPTRRAGAARSSRSAPTPALTNEPLPAAATSTSGGMLLLASALVFVSLGQLIVVLTGGIDLSVGPLTGLVVVVLSFFAGGGAERLGARARRPGRDRRRAVAVGLVERDARPRCSGSRRCSRRSRPTSSIQGDLAARCARQPAGFCRLGHHVGDQDELGLGPGRRSSPRASSRSCASSRSGARALGLELRAVGSDETRAHRLGARVNLTHRQRLRPLLAVRRRRRDHARRLAGRRRRRRGSASTTRSRASPRSCSAAPASSAAAARSSARFLGALLIQEIITASGFLQQTTHPFSDVPSVAVPYWLLGFLILFGAGLYSRARGIRTATLEADTS